MDSMKNLLSRTVQSAGFLSAASACGPGVYDLIQRTTLVPTYIELRVTFSITLGPWSSRKHSAESLNSVPSLIKSVQRATYYKYLHIACQVDT